MEDFGLDLAALLITQDLALKGCGIRGTTTLLCLKELQSGLTYR